MPTAIKATLNVPPVEPLETALDRLLELAALPADWDSYGATSVTPAARKAAAATLLTAWQGGLVTASGGPEIFPVPTGGIQFEWSGNRGEIEIEISPDGIATSLIAWKNGTYAESSPSHALNPAELIDLIKSVRS
jgi:hypothetical protein